MFGDPLLLVARLPALLVGLVLHEFAHGFASDRCGDPTPRQMGRLTLNPLAHLDLMGTICILFGPIGWAKPVPVNPAYWRKRHANYYVSLAGVATNFAIAFVATLLLRLAVVLNAPIGQAGLLILFYMIFINVALMVFNLLPIHPLDGSHVMRELLPGKYKPGFDKINRYGPIILMALVVINFRTGFLGIPIVFIVRHLQALAAIIIPGSV